MNTDYIEEDELEEPQQLTPFQMFMNENGKVVKAVVATFLLTSLVWVCVFLAIFSSTKDSKQSGDKAAEVAGQVTTAQQQKALAPRYEAKAKKDVDYTGVIIGHWEPVEVSAYKLDFSEFGTLKVVTKKHGYTERSEYKYKLLGRIVHANGEYLLVFDLTATEIYQRTLTEGQKQRTSRIPVFPAEWQNQFGLPYKDHQQEMQINIFDGYAIFAIQEREKAAEELITPPQTDIKSVINAGDPRTDQGGASLV